MSPVCGAKECLDSEHGSATSGSMRATAKLQMNAGSEFYSPPGQRHAPAEGTGRPLQVGLRWSLNGQEETLPVPGAKCPERTAHGYNLQVACLTGIRRPAKAATR